MSSDLASVIMNEPGKLPLIEVPQEPGGLFSDIQYALRCHTKDPKLELTRAFECETNPSLIRDFSRKLNDGGRLPQPVKVIHGYTAATNFIGPNLDKVCRNGFRSRDQVKFHVGHIGHMVKGDIKVQPLAGMEEQGGGSSAASSTTGERNAAEYEPRATLRCKMCIR